MTFHIHLKHLWRRKPLVLVAVLLMAFSSLLSYLCVNRGMRQIEALKQQSAKIEAFIHDEWSNIGQANRDADDAVVVSLLARGDDAESKAIRQYYRARLGKNRAGGKSLIAALKAADAQQQQRLDTINDNYLRQTVIESDIERLEKWNMFSANLAFVLQVVGLLMVIITRDMPDSV